VSQREPTILQTNHLGKLIQLLLRRGYDLIGPIERDGAIVYERIESVEELPQAWTDEQEPGRYRLRESARPALFGYAVGPQSWKKYLHPPDEKLFCAERDGATFRILNNRTQRRRPYAFLGVRACELAAIAVQDRVLLGDKFPDPSYQALRQDLFIVAVQCTQSAATCFCVSMGTGPQVRDGFDLALTELKGGEGHRFVVKAGSARGGELLAQLETTPANDGLAQEAEDAVSAAACQQVRSVDTAGIKDLLYANFEHPQWDNIATRCMGCGNCTMVCPTCFCTAVEDVSDLIGGHAERWRRWDSCFTLNFSYIHGGCVRESMKARYRQWLTHKFASWIDQFGSSGCVGCGRCITWCPAGIDVTEEIRAIRETTNNGKS
jgi:ferredoxin